MAITAIIIIAIVIIAAVAVVVMQQSAHVSSKAIPSEVRTYAKDWPVPNKDYNNSRATTDTTITSTNVNTLGLAWSFKIPGVSTFGAAASTPIVLGNTVIFQDLKANVFALDLQTGAVKWSKIYNSTFVEGPNGPAVGYGKVFVAKDANTMAALDLNTGQELWTNHLSPIPTTGIDIQPQVYDNMVYVSTVPGTGDIFYKAGGIGVIYALDQATGKQVWNFSTVINDLWGHPEVNSGGGCWYPAAIDTNTGTMYWGVANPAPFAGAKGWPSGSSFDTALYTDSIVALNHKDGKLEWFTQCLHHDIWDHDLQVSPILATSNISGDHSKIVLASGKMGNVYALDRESGEMLWTLPVGEHVNDTLDPITVNTTVLPGVLGGVETMMAYSRGMLFVPIVDFPTTYTPTGLSFANGFNPATGKGELVGVNVNYGHIAWVQKFPSPNFGSATVANDVVFTATYDGTIYAFHTLTGEMLFKAQAPSGINAWPAIVGDTVLWPCGVGGTPSLLALRLGAPPLGPTVNIASPANGATVYGPNVTVTVTVTGFDIVAPTGQANVQGQGHLIYYEDVTPPTLAGMSAIPAAGNFTVSASTSYTWRNVTLGHHTFSVQLVNNDNTSLSPPVVAFANVNDLNQAFVTVFLKAQSISFNLSTIMVPAGSNVTVVFQNLDTGIDHNFAVYTDSTASTVIFRGTMIAGPAAITYKFDAPTTPGNYFFRCDVHPTIMTGTFMVT